MQHDEIRARFSIKLATLYLLSDAIGRRAGILFHKTNQERVDLTARKDARVTDYMTRTTRERKYVGILVRLYKQSQVKFASGRYMRGRKNKPEIPQEHPHVAAESQECRNTYLSWITIMSRV